MTAAFFSAFNRSIQHIDLTQSKKQFVKVMVQEKEYRFHFIHRDYQTYDYVREYRKSILESMNLNIDSPTIQVIGDSARFGEDRIDFAKRFLFDFLDCYPKHHILYGLTGKSGDVNTFVNEWIAQKPEKQARVIGNAVSVHTPMAINKWGCHVGDTQNIAVIYPNALFGDDVQLSDYFVPQYDHAPGASMGLCLEGGAQSFLQAVNMLDLGVPIIALEKLRGPNNPSCKINGNDTLFFSAAEFLSLVKKSIIKMQSEGLKVTREGIEEIYNTYLYNLSIHGAYSFEQHKHLRVFANPNRPDYGTKIALFTQAFDKFYKNRVWKKLDLITIINYEKEVEKQAMATSISVLRTLRERNAASIDSNILNKSDLLEEQVVLPFAKL